MSASFNLGALFLLAAAGEGEPQLERFQDARVHMGTSFQIVVYAANESDAAAAFERAFSRIAALDDLLSDYKPESEVSRLSAASPTQRTVDIDLFAVLARAQHFSRLTDGAFDVTVGPLTKLWRRARRRKQLPDHALLAEARQAVGYLFMKLTNDERTVELTRPNMRLDLGGIAKGYAADQAKEAMRRLGVTRVLINAGGDVVTGDPPPGQPGWRVGVAPLDTRKPPSQVLLVQNVAVATSGDAWQFVELNGKRYSHIIDPLTGLGLTDRSSVTVIARDGTTADALASALSVMGVERGMPFINALPNVEAIMVRIENGQAKSHTSKWGDN
ncbi:MAG: FAD:protein FMN transferase [Pirellulaceae bacterium]|nr:FAD:protein FMN transferase [Pirellulaceae bacterium]